ncbi:bifunctional protein-serine/threonine kinase/phosphatase (plasmid) [Cupriavidus pinatubonensis]|uniref:bifunctional protein-serine/threonine kinase/phosphatase n=1 Tax=Cupriavidus pinatubonensis TaxID=248026 RepID=UPI001C72F7C3|nr:bifunctional protein-serine/threonine kinase/phosphatase [Cupriavidus pinatubonensis]QYY34203.1 bifunctional protein-serine/threonine kinase/phosphatase [Cupriavidus pinatubonensis]
MRALRLSIGQHSEAGRKRINQDFHGAMLPNAPRLGTKGIAVALADGIGSSAVSHVASAAAVRTFLDDYYCTAESWTVRRAAQCVLAAINSWLHAQTQRSDARFDRDRGYVCTFSALIFKGREVHLFHIGDSRIYRLHSQAWEQLTEDHRIRVSSVESYLGRALGVGPTVEIDYRCWRAEVGEVYLLASDGAYEHLDGATVRQALDAHPDDLDAASGVLVATALARGSNDNVTVQLVRVDDLPDIDARDIHRQRGHLTLPPLLQPRMHFDGYHIVRELHASSRSHVYLAVDQHNGRHVALKTPSIDLRDDPDYLDGFLMEEWVARRIDNAHVLKPHAIDRPRQYLHVAMEYVDGHTLRQWMIDHPTPDLDTVRQIIEQVAKGLQAFHRREMLHRDLRPENVMIDRTGTVKIIDFAAVHVAGLAEGTSSRHAQALVGSLQYTAPEYFLGHRGCTASDLFSLAVITYQMLTGHLPYGLQVTRLRTESDLRRLRYVAARERRPELPPWIDAVLRRALHPCARKRQEAVSEFIQDLRTPGGQYENHRRTALLERNPVVFWQSVTALLALCVMLLLGLRLTGH